MATTDTAVLIPAYDEEPRIEAVLDVVCGMDDLSIVVIDDGSRDATAERALQYPVGVVQHRSNEGKGAALESGMIYVGDARFWVFLDADLINLRREHIRQLLRPLREDADMGMTVGQFVEGTKHVDWAQRFFAILNGQRALSDAFARSLPGLGWSRFGMEVFLSRFAAHSGWPVGEPFLPGLTHHTKESKMGAARGVWARLSMYRECLSAMRRWRNHLSEERRTALSADRCRILQEVEGKGASQG